MLARGGVNVRRAKAQLKYRRPRVTGELNTWEFRLLVHVHNYPVFGAIGHVPNPSELAFATCRLLNGLHDQVSPSFFSQARFCLPKQNRAVIFPGESHV